VKVYPLGLTCGEAALLFVREFPPTATGPGRDAGWFAADGAFYSAEGWVSLGRYPVVAA